MSNDDNEQTRLKSQSEVILTELSRFCRSLPLSSADLKPQTGELTFVINIKRPGQPSKSPAVRIKSRQLEAFAGGIPGPSFSYPAT